MVTVAYQGMPGANSEIALFGYFGRDAAPVPCHSFSLMLDTVLTGAADYGVLPIENSLAGSVIDSYDLLIERPVFIVGELYQQIRYGLMALPGVALEDVHTVFSHPQALAQTRDYLDAHPAMQPVAAFDTAGAAKMVADEGRRDAAAIAPLLAAERYGLSVLARGIETNAENYTRMVIVGREQIEPATDAVKTSVIAGLSHERGSLARLLHVLQDAGMNLTKIESRPIVGRPWEYLFYLDWEGRLTSAALDEAKRTTVWWKHLGVYPRGSVIPAP